MQLNRIELSFHGLDIALWENVHQKATEDSLDGMWYATIQPLYRQLHVNYDLQLASFLGTNSATVLI